MVLAEQHERQRANDDWPGSVANLGFRLIVGIDRAIAGSRRGRAVKLWHEVVVVGIEPLGHLERRDMVAAARHRRVGRQRDWLARRVVETLRHHAPEAGHIEHVVVIGKVVAWDVLDTGLLLDGPGRRADLLRDGVDIVFTPSCRTSNAQ